MSITRRILESAQSGFAKLTSLVIVDDEPLSHVDSAALQAELTARKAAKARAPRPPHDNPIAKLATSAPDARERRARLAAERAARVHKARDQRAAAQRSADDDAFRRMKEQAARGGGGASAGASGGSARAPKAGTSDAQIAAWYGVLDIPVGSDLAAIKTAYRKMMRKYHPDLHTTTPQKQKAATELSMRVTTAYNGLCAHLDPR